MNVMLAAILAAAKAGRNRLSAHCCTQQKSPRRGFSEIALMTS
ncbi:MULTISPECIES: hypothetical protein [unclassified Bradyrhizobium]